MLLQGVDYADANVAELLAFVVGELEDGLKDDGQVLGLKDVGLVE